MNRSKGQSSGLEMMLSAPGHYWPSCQGERAAPLLRSWWHLGLMTPSLIARLLDRGPRAQALQHPPSPLGRVSLSPSLWAVPNLLAASGRGGVVRRVKGSLPGRLHRRNRGDSVSPSPSLFSNLQHRGLLSGLGTRANR